MKAYLKVYLVTFAMALLPLAALAVNFDDSITLTLPASGDNYTIDGGSVELHSHAVFMELVNFLLSAERRFKCCPPTKSKDMPSELTVNESTTDPPSIVNWSPLAGRVRVILSSKVTAKTAEGKSAIANVT